MIQLSILIGCGFTGGLVRGAIGIAKNNLQAFSLHYFVVTLFISSFVGAFAAAVLFSDCRMALLAGYAGTDIFENTMKLMRTQASRIIYFKRFSEFRN